MTASPASWSGEWNPVIQLTIRRLTQPTDLITVGNGPDQFPSVREVRGPLQTIRYLVWRDALGTDSAFDENAALDAIEWLTSEERATVLDQCAFIREHTVPFKPWRIPDNPLLGADWVTSDDQRPHPLHPTIRRPSHTPPPWANNPARTRRNKYGPTRRVK
ncbi:hypothetical protein [Prescottella agglutinans]|uniref:Uncharacterized protein n=1 Tax=Prescottella agglutinans TaxID=1644129 RepID=A0ABT6MG33_9NOCA|nr:hypothetical protein [Prescottella agglutinans]MDH6282839.1 hypothetical protein [Prescottella agglutinans]